MAYLFSNICIDNNWENNYHWWLGGILYFRHSV